MICNNNCCACDNLIYTGTVTASGTAVNITLPAQAICNNEKLCFVITTSIPVVTTPLPVTITVGATTVFKMVNQCGNFVYSDQLKSRKVYCVSMKTDSLLAKNLKCNLCPTSVDLPCLPATTAVASSPVVSMSSKGVDTK